MPSFMTISPLAEHSSEEEPRVGGACISLRDWLALSAFLLCVCTSLFGKDWRTAHLSPTEHTLTERDRALLHSSWGICFSPGVLRERTCCPRCWMKQTGMKAGGQWMDRMNNWRASSGTRLTGLLYFCFFFFFFPFTLLASSMPHWQVLAVSATCELICFQADSVLRERPLGAATSVQGQFQLTQTWGRCAASRTDWRNNISKVMREKMLDI